MERLRNGPVFETTFDSLPGRDISEGETPETVAVAPARLPFVKPKLHVHEGDRVAVGSLLFTDKRMPKIRYLSPGGGRVARIDYGPRRVIEEVVIQLDPTETQESFPAMTRSDIEAADRDLLVERLLNGGVWPLIRQLPFRDCMPPDARPPMIIVSLRPGDMFSPLPEMVIQENIDQFETGLSILKKLSARIVVAAPEGSLNQLTKVKGHITHRFGDRYPSGDPGVILYQIRKQPAENPAGYISAADLIRLADLFITGAYPTRSLVSCCGLPDQKAVHVRTRQGAPVRTVVGPPLEKKKVLAQGVFSGFRLSWEGHLGLFDDTLVLADDNPVEVPFGFLKPGLNAPTESRAFLSGFFNPAVRADIHLHGEARSCVNCGYCRKKCPVDLFPQFLMKTALVEETDELLEMGLLDCTGCGICTYVCPSKIELCDILTRAKNDYYKDRGI